MHENRRLSVMEWQAVAGEGTEGSAQPQPTTEADAQFSGGGSEAPEP